MQVEIVNGWQNMRGKMYEMWVDSPLRAAI